MSATRKVGRPVLGAISGFFLGLFTCTTLALFGAITLDDSLWTILPLAGLVAGIVVPLVVRAVVGERRESALAIGVPITPLDEPPLEEPPPAELGTAVEEPQTEAPPADPLDKGDTTL